MEIRKTEYDGRMEAVIVPMACIAAVEPSRYSSREVEGLYKPTSNSLELSVHCEERRVASTPKLLG
jgi:hypothetical protein